MKAWWKLTLEATLAVVGIAVAWHLRRPRPVLVEISYPPVPLEPWEEFAEFGGDVGAEEGETIHGDVGEAVGSGHPVDLCPPGANPRELPESCVPDPLADPRFAPRPGTAPLGRPGKAAVWPLATRHRRRLVTSYWTADGLRGAWGRHFGAKRVTSEGQIRRHSGIDLFAKAGDQVIAPEDGLLLAILPFHHDTWSLYLRIVDGRVIALAEVEPYSWREFGVGPGDFVHQGEPLARVGTMRGGGRMLHVELYAPGMSDDDEVVGAIRRGEMNWTEAQPPAMLRDPSAYLVDAATRTYRTEDGNG